MEILSQYKGKSSHGYYWCGVDGKLQYSATLWNSIPEEFFYYTPYTKWWNVQCELDWYRMRKEYRGLKGDIEPGSA